MSREDEQFHLRLPAELLAKLKRLAAREGRSITAQIIWLIKKALGDL